MFDLWSELDGSNLYKTFGNTRELPIGGALKQQVVIVF